MKKHVQVYVKENSFYVADAIMCELCRKVACDIHHIEPRGMGGDPSKDVNENLVALCRSCHTKIEGKKKYIEELKAIAKRRIYARA